MRVMLDIPSQYYVVLLWKVREVGTARSHGSKISGGQKIKNSLKKWIRTVSDLVDLVQFHLIYQMLAKFSGVKSERTVFKLRKRKRNFCVVFAYSIKRASEIRKFHVAVVQRRLRNVQKSVMHVQSCRFANINLLLFNCSRCRRRRRCLNSLLLWSRNFATMVTWRHTPSLYCVIV